ncbi:MAG: DUF2092 domain-containing protein [Armatimonadota bacterium]|nr:DUF2092 domain-containing protein [Armatimonadota bacterium]
MSTLTQPWKWALSGFCMMLAALPASAIAAQPDAPPARGRTAQQAGTIRIDPKAQVLLNQWKTALSNLKSFSATVTATVTFPNQGAGSEPEVTRYSLAFQRPNLLKWVSIPERDTEIVSDGTHLYYTVVHGPKLYATQAAPPDLKIDIMAGGLYDLDLAHVVKLFDGDNVGRMVKLADRVSIRAGKLVVLNGEPVDTLLVTSGSGTESWSVQYSLGHTDHLPRRRLNIYHVGFSMNNDLTFSGVKVNPNLDAKTFTFTPPPNPVEPAAQALLNKMAAAYTALNTFSAIVRIRGKMDTEVIPDGRSAVLMQRPNLLSCTTKTTTATIRTVCDGTNLYNVQSSQKVSYQRIPAASNF